MRTLPYRTEVRVYLTEPGHNPGYKDKVFTTQVDTETGNPRNIETVLRAQYANLRKFNIIKTTNLDREEETRRFVERSQQQLQEKEEAHRRAQEEDERGRVLSRANEAGQVEYESDGQDDIDKAGESVKRYLRLMKGERRPETAGELGAAVAGATGRGLLKAVKFVNWWMVNSMSK
jgi:hypothetical protein